MASPKFSFVLALNLGFLLLALSLTSCSEGQKENSSQICAQKADFKIEDRLFFGADIPNKGQMRPEIFQDFLDKKVTPAFPEGFSVFKAQGQWLYKTSKIQKEPSWEIDLIYSPTKKREAAIKNIIKSYKEMFHQEAVLRLRASICATFL